VATPHHGAVLLSIQPDDYVPPDESRLEDVVGVGMDGELIYADDPAYQQNSPHTKPLGQDEPPL